MRYTKYIDVHQFFHYFSIYIWSSKRSLAWDTKYRCSIRPICLFFFTSFSSNLRILRKISSTFRRTIFEIFSLSYIAKSKKSNHLFPSHLNIHWSWTPLFPTVYSRWIFFYRPPLPLLSRYTACGKNISFLVALCYLRFCLSSLFVSSANVISAVLSPERNRARVFIWISLFHLPRPTQFTDWTKFSVPFPVVTFRRLAYVSN